MLNKYLDFINENFNIAEGYVSHPTVIYWNENVNDVLNDEWFDISVSRYGYPIYIIKFRIGNDKNDTHNYYQAVLENKGSNDIYYMENPEPFIAKFKTEFSKHSLEYINNMKYDPKALGDLSFIRASAKFNL
jgi:hypothetical protein